MCPNVIGNPGVGASHIMQRIYVMYYSGTHTHIHTYTIRAVETALIVCMCVGRGGGLEGQVILCIDFHCQGDT